MNQDTGGISGSREPSPAVSALPGFDPGRMDAAWFVNLVVDYGGGYNVGTFCDSKAFHKRYPEFVAVRNEHKRRGDKPSEAMVAALIDFAEAIAMKGQSNGNQA